MDADDCACIIEGVAAVLDLLAADGDVVDDPAPIYELLARDVGMSAWHSKL